MSYSYTLRNIQTGTVEYTGLKAGEVHQITGIPSQRVSRYAADGKVYPEDGPGRPEAWQRHIRGKDSEVEKSCQQET